MKIRCGRASDVLASLVLLTVAHFAIAQDAPASAIKPIKPSAMPRIGTVDERFQSYNIEMVEVTGGRFWKPYASQTSANGAAPQPPSANQPVGMDQIFINTGHPSNFPTPACASWQPRWGQLMCG